MKGDFSRLTWDRRKHYGAVLMQQGRLQLDADWNEQIDIIMHRLETEVADYVGHSGVPAGTPDGFRISLSSEPAPGGGPLIEVSPGRIYLQGRLYENDEPDRTALNDLLPALPDSGAARVVVYLDTWQRHVTFIDDPDLREVALGGPDTATRLQNAWRLRCQAVPADTSPPPLRPPWQPAQLAMSTGRLNARLNTGPAPVENQLYRVEVHQVQGGAVNYTWSRDNASTASRVTAVHAIGRSLDIAGGGRDRETALVDRQWVELLTAAQELSGTRGVVVQLEQVRPGQATVTQESWPWSATDVPPLAVLRRWDGPNGLGAGPVVTRDTEGGWLALDAGIEVRFESAPDGSAEFVPGDYWLIPSRTATASIEWPLDAGRPAAQPARGVRHAFAALALLERDGGGGWSVVAGGDLRPLVSPLDEGFVSKGVAGDLVRGPLSVQPLLTATADSQTLTALTIDPSFDDAGHQGGRHLALLVTGDSDLGAEEKPVSTTAYGYFSVLGTAYARTLNVSGEVSANTLVVSGPPTAGVDTGWTLQIGDSITGIGIELPRPDAPVTLPSGASPSYQTYLRFGEGNGSSLTFGRAREFSETRYNRGDAGAVLTVVDRGFVGVGTTKPITTLHIGGSGGGTNYLALTTTRDLSLAARILRDSNTPMNTVLIGGAYSATVELFWKAPNGVLFAASLPATDQLTNQLRSS